MRGLFVAGVLLAAIVLMGSALPIAYSEENQSIGTQVRIVAKAQVSLTIVNQPPAIVGISLPQEIHKADLLSCRVDVRDEHPDALRLKTTWFINERPVSETAAFDVAGVQVRVGDSVRCVVVAIDDQGLASAPAESSAKVVNRSGFAGLLDALAI